MNPSERVPAALQGKFAAISALTDAFCDLQLNDEYKAMIRQVLAAMSRKRPTPLQSGRDNSWAAGVVHAVGMVNFLFDSKQHPHCKATDIYMHFGVGSSSGQAKSKEVQNALRMGQMSPEWTLPSMIDQNPMVWMLKIDGLVFDARELPLDVQEIALARGLIPYIPVKS